MTNIKIATLNLFNRMGEWGHRAPLVIDQLEGLAADRFVVPESGAPRGSLY